MAGPPGGDAAALVRGLHRGSCAAAAAGRDGLCHAHYAAWYRRRLAHPGAVLAVWARHAGPAGAAAHAVVLRGLPDRVVAELLAGVQRRTDAGLRTRPDSLRCLVKLLHARRAASVLDLAGGPEHVHPPPRRRAAAVAAGRVALRAVGPGEGAGQGRVAAGSARAARQAGLHRPHPAVAARGRQVVGGGGPAAAPRPARRPTARDTINALAALSESLRLSRDDGGDDPGALGRDDIVAFTNRLAHQQRTGQMTFRTRLRLTRRVFRLFNDVHVLGMTGAGQPAAGLPAAFALRRGDIPKDPDREPRPRSLPPAVLKVIAANLDVLEERCGVPERRITELLIDTGRRPDEICALAWDCLERDAVRRPGADLHRRQEQPARPAAAGQRGHRRGHHRAEGLGSAAATRTPRRASWRCSPATRATGTAPSRSAAVPTATPTASSPTPSPTCCSTPTGSRSTRRWWCPMPTGTATPSGTPTPGSRPTCCAS